VALLSSASVTDNFGNRDNLGRGASEQEKEWEKPYLVGSKGYSGGDYQLKVVPIASVTEVIEVIG
jgi:hypothetical protein